MVSRDVGKVNLMPRAYATTHKIINLLDQKV
jgi:hypothetical protein